MERWVNKVAVVTGASSGIGAAIVADLLKAGVIVVGLARRVELVQQIASQVDVELAGSLHAFRCDITEEDDIKAAFSWIDEHLGGADILVNNAGLLPKFNLIDSNNTAILKQTIDTNLFGSIICTREAVQSMKRRSVSNGHVVLINSIFGHGVPFVQGADSTNIYPATKHALTATTEVLRQEFIREGMQIKITVCLNHIAI